MYVIKHTSSGVTVWLRSAMPVEWTSERARARPFETKDAAGEAMRRLPRSPGRWTVETYAGNKNGPD
jgi:hypothetical protein